MSAQYIILQMAENVSTATIRRHNAILRQYYKYAVKYGAASFNPFEAVELPRNKAVIDKMSDKVYSEGELTRIFSALRYEPLIWRCFVFLALDSGCRRGELVGLKWSDFDGANVWIRRSAFKVKGHSQALKEPKGRRGRKIHISGTVLKTLKHLKLQQKAAALADGRSWSEDCFVFSFNGSDMLSVYSPSQWWRRFLGRHRLPRKRLHDLRHTSATTSLRHGIDIRTVSYRLGHRSIKTTMIYLEPDEGSSVSVMEKLLKKAVTL